MNNVIFRQLTDSKLKIKGLNFTFDRRKIIIRDIPANRTSNGDILLQILRNTDFSFND